MGRFAKTWVLWVLMLVLPLQAVASAAQLSCETGRQRHSVVAKPGHAGEQRQAGLHAADHAACSPCAGCCATPGQAMPEPNAGSELPVALQPSRHAGFIPERLERPPRFLVS